MSDAVAVEQSNDGEGLAHLGLIESDLREPIYIALGRRKLCTSNHPVIYAGIVMWAELIMELRNKLVPKGWTTAHIAGVELIISPCGTKKLVVAQGDEKTGVAEGIPKTKYELGPVISDVLLAQRSQHLLLGGIEVLRQVMRVDNGNFETWILLHHLSPTGAVRAELSRPSIVEGGLIEAWHHRILLPTTQPGDQLLKDVAPSQPKEIDVPLRKREVGGA